MSCTVNLSCLNNSINVTFSKVKIANQNYDLQEIDKRTKDLSLTKMSINNSFQSLVDQLKEWINEKYKFNKLLLKVNKCKL